MDAEASCAMADTVTALPLTHDTNPEKLGFTNRKSSAAGALTEETEALAYGWYYHREIPKIKGWRASTGNEEVEIQRMDTMH